MRRRCAPQGYSVNVNQNIGPTEVTVQALKSGSLTDLPRVPRHLRHRCGRRPAWVPHAPGRLRRGREHYALSHGIAAAGTDAVLGHHAHRRDRRLRGAEHVRGIGDLAQVAGDLTLGAPPQFHRARRGLPALERRLRLRARSATGRWRSGDQYSALDDGAIEAARSTPPTASWPPVTTRSCATRAACSGGATWCRSSRPRCWRPRARRSPTRSSRQRAADDGHIRRLNYAVSTSPARIPPRWPASSCRPTGCWRRHPP